MRMKSSSSMSVGQAVSDLKNNGYSTEFRRDPNRLYCVEAHRWIGSEQFTVDESYHFEVRSSPNDDRVLYAISSDMGIKGVLVEGYGVYADNISHELAEKLVIVNHVNL